MKKTVSTISALALTLMLILGIMSFATAGTITPAGVNQGDLVNYLTNTGTAVNEVKSDYNSTFGSYSATRIMVNDLQTKYNATFRALSTINHKLNHSASFDTYTAVKVYMGTTGAARSTATADSTVLSGKRMSTTDLTLVNP